MSLQAGREWTVYERDAEVEPHARRIRCRYDFVAASGERATQVNEHHYALPEQLSALLAAAGFEVERLCGGFEGEAFDEEESEHMVYRARLVR
mmetsp:Transcript_18526/g.60166  ORF Transcript_18526/g.60166 Transcript_18526/m.60166 type:complete len:93 (+) Transcript_18526:28-306(+)